MLGSIARIVHATHSPLGKPPNAALAGFFGEMLPAQLGFFESHLSDGRPFLAGTQPSIADCTLQAAFQFARFGGLEIDRQLSQLARWDSAYRERAPASRVLVV